MEGYASSVSGNGAARLEVGLVKTDAKSKEGFLHIRVSAIKEPKRVPMNIICLIDTSGSMSTNVELKSSTGEIERTNLTMLDLAVHAVRTVANGLNEQDMLGIIGWAKHPDPDAMKLTKMDAAGRAAASKYVDKLDACYSTGMIEALEAGFNMVEDNGRPTAIFLLTDGAPDEIPRDGGFSKFVNGLMDKCSKDVTVNTFGFGYNVKSDLLMDIAQAGHGTFSFIPDGGLLGTVMINSLANTLLSAFSNTQLSVELADGITFVRESLALPKGSLVPPLVNADGSVVFNIGTVHYEQPRSVVVPVKIAPDFSESAPVCSVAMNCFASGEKVTVVVEDAVTQVLPASRLSYSQALVAEAKTIFADALLTVILTRQSYSGSFISLLESATTSFHKCAEEMKALQTILGGNAQIGDIIKDCEGQAIEAVSRVEWFKRWGDHYLRSLCVAHEYEICNNFKDPGVQHYGGELFASIRDSLDDIFQSLPAPVAKPPKYAMYSASRVSRRAAAPISMSRFMDASSGCFAASCNVSMADGTSKRVADIHKGDVVRTGSSSDATATVVCVIECRSAGEVCVLSPSGLIITPWHPVDIDGNDKWTFPANNTNAVRKPASEPVFTFVLDRTHSVIVNGIRCVTLGHGITTGDDVRAHQYFGSNAYITDLQKHFTEAYSNGHIILPENCQFNHDPATNHVNGFHF